MTERIPCKAYLGAAAALTLLGAGSCLAAGLPQVELLAGGEIGPPQSQPIAAAAARSGRFLVVRSQDNGHAVVLYALVPATSSAASVPTPPPTPGFRWPWQPSSAAAPPRATGLTAMLSPVATGPSSPSAPAQPAFEALPVAHERAAVQDLAMAATPRKAVLGILGTSDQENFVAVQSWSGACAHAFAHVPAILQQGPATPSHLAIAIAPDGVSLLAWTARLPGRPASIHWRPLGPGLVDPRVRIAIQPGSDQKEPAVAAVPGGFLLSFVRAPVESAPGTSDSLQPDADWTRIAIDQAADEPGAWPRSSVVVSPIDAQGKPMGQEFETSSWGLDHPAAVPRGAGADVFWCDPEGGGRELRFCPATPTGWRGVRTHLRTDLRPELSSPYAVVPVADSLWLVIYAQRESDQGPAMVVEGRLYFPQDLAISPPLLLGRADGAVTLKGLAQAGPDTWVALWDQLDAGQHHLMFRPLRVRF